MTISGDQRFSDQSRDHATTVIPTVGTGLSNASSLLWYEISTIKNATVYAYHQNKDRLKNLNHFNALQISLFFQRPSQICIQNMRFGATFTRIQFIHQKLGSREE